MQKSKGGMRAGTLQTGTSVPGSRQAGELSPPVVKGMGHTDTRGRVQDKRKVPLRVHAWHTVARQEAK